MQYYCNLFISYTQGSWPWLQKVKLGIIWNLLRNRIKTILVQENDDLPSEARNRYCQ